MGEARRRKLAGLMPEKTRKLSWRRCDLCDRDRVPVKPFMFVRPAFGVWPALNQELRLCNTCHIELNGGRAAFPGDAVTANRYVARMRLLTRRPWKWHTAAPAHPRLFYLEEAAISATGEEH